jgi:RNA polymerase sigma factor (sigma-70 family)
MRDAAMDEPEQGKSARKLAANPGQSSTSPASVGDADTIAAFSKFYRESLPKLVAFLMYLGATLPDATDLAHEAMVAAFRSWNVIEYPTAWTRRVASRALLREMTRVEDPVGELPELGTLLKNDDAVDWEEQHEVLRLMRMLPPRQRQVLAWTFDGFKPSEIADELNLKPEVVRANLKKARRAIASHLAAREGGAR